MKAVSRCRWSLTFFSHVITNQGATPLLRRPRRFHNYRRPATSRSRGRDTLNPCSNYDARRARDVQRLSLIITPRPRGSSCQPLSVIFTPQPLGEKFITRSLPRSDKRRPSSIWPDL